MNEIAIRPATLEDAGQISMCVRAAYEHYIERIGKPPRPMLENYEKIIQQHRVLVAEDGDRLAGVLVLGQTPDGFRVMNIAVHPSLQKTGVGKTLLQFAEAEARRLGYDSIYLSTHERMTENQSLYSRIGYREYDRRIEEGYSRVYMRKRLVDDAV
jgi:ribosomal protein S18 acetylase RimI-like enzyme